MTVLAANLAAKKNRSLLQRKEQKRVSNRGPIALDTTLLFAAVALALIGWVMISSASIDYAGHRFGDPLFHSKRHLIYMLVAAAVAIAGYHVPVAIWNKSGPYLLFLSFLILVLILIPGLGHTANNATRWLSLGPLTLQGSEVAKLGVIVYLGNYLVRQNELVRSHWSGFLNPMAVMAMLVVLILLEPDFGAVVVLLAAALGMLFLGGVRLWQFLLLLAVSGGSVWLMVSSSVERMKRLSSYLNPWADQFGEGYQLTQSLIAFGRGDWFGLGLGNSIQKLFYLPEAHTDFVFAILAEELGLVGCLLFLALYSLLVVRILLIARRAETRGEAFGAYVAYGIAIIFSVQLFINVGVNIGLLPTKGLTLPFISYGGSSLLVSSLAIALVLRIDREMTAVAVDEKHKRYGAVAKAAVSNAGKKIRQAPLRNSRSKVAS